MAENFLPSAGDCRRKILKAGEGGSNFYQKWTINQENYLHPVKGVLRQYYYFGNVLHFYGRFSLFYKNYAGEFIIPWKNAVICRRKYWGFPIFLIKCSYMREISRFLREIFSKMRMPVKNSVKYQKITKNILLWISLQIFFAQTWNFNNTWEIWIEIAIVTFFFWKSTFLVAPLGKI